MQDIAISIVWPIGLQRFSALSARNAKPNSCEKESEGFSLNLSCEGSSKERNSYYFKLRKNIKSKEIESVVHDICSAISLRT